MSSRQAEDVAPTRTEADTSIGPSTSKSCPPLPALAIPVPTAPRRDPNVGKHLGSLFSGSGSGSSSSKLPLFSSPQGTTPSSLSLSHIPTSETPLTSLSLAELPRPSCEGKEAKLAPPAGPQEPPKHAEQAVPPNAETPSPSLSSDSDALGAPTRASIRAWAKATRPGPPRDSPSPVDPSGSPQSGSDSMLARQGTTSPAGLAPSVAHPQYHPFRPTPDSTPDTRDGCGPGTDDRPLSSSASGEDGTSSGNDADVESGAPASPQHPPGTHHPRRRRLPTLSSPVLAAHGHGRPSVSSSDAPPALVAAAQGQEQIDRLDRRQHRHPSSQSARIRHRERDHRERDRRPRASSSQCQVPAPPQTLRPLQVSTGGPDILEEISRMLVSARGPLNSNGRTRGDVGLSHGMPQLPGREEDVLDDIYVMVRLSGL